MANNSSDLFCNPITNNLFRRACRLTKGGISGEIYAANLGEIDTVTVVDKVVTAITMKINPLTLQPFFWYRIVPKKQTAGIKNVLTKGTNTSFISQELDFQVIGMETESKSAFESLINGEAVFIGCDNNDIRHMMGHKSGAEMTEGEIGTGIALDDLVGTTAKFIAQETFVTPTVETGIVIQVLAKDGISVENVTL